CSSPHYLQHAVFVVVWKRHGGSVWPARVFGVLPRSRDPRWSGPRLSGCHGMVGRPSPCCLRGSDGSAGAGGNPLSHAAGLSVHVLGCADLALRLLLRWHGLICVP